MQCSKGAQPVGRVQASSIFELVILSYLLNVTQYSFIYNWLCPFTSVFTLPLRGILYKKS